MKKVNEKFSLASNFPEVTPGPATTKLLLQLLPWSYFSFGPMYEKHVYEANKECLGEGKFRRVVCNVLKLLQAKQQLFSTLFSFSHWNLFSLCAPDLDITW